MTRFRDVKEFVWGVVRSPVNNKGVGPGEGGNGQPSNHNAGLTPAKERGKKGRIG